MACLHRVLHEEHAEIGGDAIEAARMYDARAASLGLVLVRVDHSTHPEHFAGQIAVVRSGRRTRGHEFGAVKRVRTHCCAGNAGAFGEPAHERSVGRVSYYEWQTRRVYACFSGERVPYGREFGFAASSERPGKRGAVVLEEVLGGEPSDKPGGSPDDHVKVSRLRLHNAH